MIEKDREAEPIKVTDRRSFTSEGERRRPEEPASRGQEDEAGTEREPLRGQGFELHREKSPDAGTQLPEVEFNSFILSLASTAFIHLGEMKDPVTGNQEINTPAARQIIDIIDMLHDKTKGNLEPNEDEFIRGILYELRMKFTQKATGK